MTDPYPAHLPVPDPSEDDDIRVLRATLALKRAITTVSAVAAACLGTLFVPLFATRGEKGVSGLATVTSGIAFAFFAFLAVSMRSPRARGRRYRKIRLEQPEEAARLDADTALRAAWPFREWLTGVVRSKPLPVFVGLCSVVSFTGLVLAANRPVRPPARAPVVTDRVLAAAIPGVGSGTPQYSGYYAKDGESVLTSVTRTFPAPLGASPATLVPEVDAYVRADGWEPTGPIGPYGNDLGYSKTVDGIPSTLELLTGVDDVFLTFDEPKPPPDPTTRPATGPDVVPLLALLGFLASMFALNADTPRRTRTRTKNRKGVETDSSADTGASGIPVRRNGGLRRFARPVALRVAAAAYVAAGVLAVVSAVGGG